MCFQFLIRPLSAGTLPSRCRAASKNQVDSPVLHLCDGMIRLIFGLKANLKIHSNSVFSKWYEFTSDQNATTMGKRIRSLTLDDIGT